MRIARIARMATGLTAVMVLGATTAAAEFQMVEDFEGLLPGPIHGQNGWTAVSENSAVTTDPSGGSNQVLSVVTESTHLFKNVPLLNGTVRMMFMRFRYADQLNLSFGMSDVSNPSRFDHFEAELSLTNATSELRINDDGTYDVLAVLQPNTWYNCWLLIDNENDQCQVWLHDRGLQPATAEDQLEAMGQTVFVFRNGGGTQDLVNYYIKTGGGSGVDGPFFLDDVYLEDTNALNLANPAAPTSDARLSAAVTSLSLAPPYPNPVQGRTTFRFAVPRAATASLAILDAQGRLVADLFSGTPAAARHEVVWQGRDRWGRPVAHGVYFCRLRSGEAVRMQRIVLAR